MKRNWESKISVEKQLPKIEVVGNRAVPWRLRWMMEEDTPDVQAHFCAFNESNPRVKAAAVCGYGYPGMKPYVRARENATACADCMRIDRSGIRIVFRDPFTREKIVVREAKR